MEVLLNTKYLKNLTHKFMDNLMSLSYCALEEDVIYFLNLDIIGIQIDGISIYVGTETIDYLLDIVFVNQKTGKYEFGNINIVFADDKIESAKVYTEESFDKEFLEIVPALEKYLVNQLYILKMVLEETEE